MTASKHTACSEGLRRRGVASDVGDAHVRGVTTMVPGEGSVKNHCMSGGQEGSSPASVFSSVRPWVRDKDPALSLAASLFPRLASHLLGVTCLSLAPWKALAVGMLAWVFLAGALHYKSCRL